MSTHYIHVQSQSEVVNQTAVYHNSIRLNITFERSNMILKCNSIMLYTYNNTFISHYIRIFKYGEII